MKADFLTILREGLKEMALSLPDRVLRDYALYQRELKNWSRAYNITGFKSERDMAIGLFLDSLLYLKASPELSRGSPRVADVGSGGGFPGLVLKIARPGMDLTLIEASWKKAAFLRHMTGKLGLQGVTVLQGRLEDYARGGKAGVFDILLTRALFRTVDFIRKTEGITSPGSILILGKGPGYREELKEVYAWAGTRAREFRLETVALALPLTDIKRYFVKVILS